MTDVEFVQITMPGYTDIQYKTKIVNKKLTDFIYKKINHLYDIKINDKQVPIYHYNDDEYLLIKDLYKFEGISQQSASERLKKMERNNEDRNKM